MSGDTVELVTLLNRGLGTLLYFWAIEDLLCPDQSAQTQPQRAGVHGNTESVLPPAHFQMLCTPVQRQYQGFGQLWAPSFPMPPALSPAQRPSGQHFSPASLCSLSL